MKIKKIKNCRECEDIIEIGYPDKYPACAEKFKMQGIIFKILDKDIIPDWCPLEDFPQEKCDHDWATPAEGTDDVIRCKKCGERLRHLNETH